MSLRFRCCVASLPLLLTWACAAPQPAASPPSASDRETTAARAGGAVPGVESSAARASSLDDLRAAVVAPGAYRLFDGMGAHTRRVTTRSAVAQACFDQGLVWAFAFNHDEAIRAFQQAARVDPGCAMAYWGIALCSGPHINRPDVPPDNARRAWQAIQLAQYAAGSATPLERELIEALAHRYGDPSSGAEDRRPLDEAYAQAMKTVWAAHPEDADIGVLYAEALMDLQPWDLWTRDGQPKGNTNEIVAVLESAMAIDRNHPGANHLYIHAMEAGPQPQKALAAADRLGPLVPAAGHLVHMPAHIYARLGRWADAADTNIRASEADRAYRAQRPQQDFYRLYMAHNPHFLAWASMNEGRSQAALRAADDMISAVPPEFIRTRPEFIDAFMNIRLEVLKRFGRWDEILAEPAPPESLPLTTALWHMSRGVALAAKHDIPGAESEQGRFLECVERTPAGAPFGNNKARAVFAVAAGFLSGEIAYARGDMDRAIADLQSAVKLEDELNYNESPDWMTPVRHALGAVLMEANRHADAEQVYQEDLKRNPQNGWSLYGLAECLKARNAPEAAEARAQFEKAWARADTRIGTTCLCVPARKSVE